MPAFLDDAHRALSRKLAGDLEGIRIDDHDAARLVERLVRADAFALVVDPQVRALCVAREALGYVSPMADSIFAVQGLGSWAIGQASGFARRDEILAEVKSGARVCAFALTEPEAGTDVAAMKSVAARDGDRWRIDGEKVFISNAGIAHHYLVFANADPSLGKKGISAFLVAASAPGLTIEKVPMSVDHPLGRLHMKWCEAELVGEVGQGMRLALGTLDVFRTSVGAAACGMARRALDETLRRVRERVLFGKRLVDQQLTQARLAEMATDLDASRLLVYRAAFLKDRGERASTEVAMAKMFATEAAQRVIDAAVQLHGGLGVTLGSAVEQLYREIRPLRIYEGTTEIQKLIIGGAFAASEGP
ncbi:MAG: acyl-CoA dehydrogenase family protein [Myxococcales bacterium]|nr:acyl-CoA dehydrogenase family protein [Myxococcales bacterium]